PGWTTDVVLTNVSEFFETGTIQFFAQGSGAVATPAATLTVNGNSGSTFDYGLLPHSSARFSTAGASSTVQVGSVVVTPAKASASVADPPSALSIIDSRKGGVLVSETSVPAAPVGVAFRMYMEARGATGEAGAIRSGLAVTNPSSSVATISVELRNLNG